MGTPNFFAAHSQGLISAHCLDRRSLRVRKEITIKVLGPAINKWLGVQDNSPITRLGKECAPKKGGGPQKKGGGDICRQKG